MNRRSGVVFVWSVIIKEGTTQPSPFNRTICFAVVWYTGKTADTIDTADLMALFYARRANHIALRACAVLFANLCVTSHDRKSCCRSLRTRFHSGCAGHVMSTSFTLLCIFSPPRSTLHCRSQQRTSGRTSVPRISTLLRLLTGRIWRYSYRTNHFVAYAKVAVLEAVWSIAS